VRLQAATDRVYVDHGVVDYAVSLVLATREPAHHGLPELQELISYGASPRASLGLVAGARALALLRGRGYALPQDVFDVAPDVLRHRLVLSYEALARGISVEHVLARLLSTVPAPRLAPSQDPTAAAPAPRPATVPPPPPATPSAPTPPPAGTSDLGPWARPSA
jgi:MoxR-like ATPase